MVDDVATTGGSILKAIEGMKTEFLPTFTARSPSSTARKARRKNLAQQGIKLATIFKRSDFPEI
jgi:orotate phosphoribosyltransferase